MNEVVLKIVGKLDLLYGNSIDQKEVRDAIEEVLVKYEITPKSTEIATIDDMQDKIMLYIAVKNIDGLSKRTLKSYSNHLLKFSDVMRKNVADISTMDIRVYLSNYSKTGVKNTTIATKTDILRGFFTFLENEGYIDKSPMKKIKTIKVNSSLRKALTKEELEILRGGAKTLRQKALLEFFYSTGCRLEEVENVKKHDIDWQSMKLKVIGKGNKERVVYLNATVKVHLQKYILSRLDQDDALFVTARKPYTNMGRRAIQREIDIITKQSGLKKNVFPHLLRHTAATHWLHSGMNITTVQAILGHDDVGTTQIYAQISSDTTEHEFKKYS